MMTGNRKFAKIKRKVIPKTWCSVRYGAFRELEMRGDRGSRESETGG